MQPNNSSAYLIIRQGKRWTDVFRLEPGRPLVVGRASSNEIPVGDERSSRRHAEIFFEDGWKVRDLGSRNGTFVDGVRLTQPVLLTPGCQIVVASCRMTFSNSLEDVSPPLEIDENFKEMGGDTTRQFSSITHRQSKSAILDPDSVAGALAQAGRAMAPPVKAPEVSLLQLAFELAKETQLTSGCELALQRLLDTTKCQSGGIMEIQTDGKLEGHRRILAAVQKSGKAYNPVSDTLLKSVLKEGAAVLARNIHDSTLSDLSTPVIPSTRAESHQASQVVQTSSAIVAPIKISGMTLGVLHLYSRVGEPDLAPSDLEMALAVAEVLATFMSTVERQKTLEKKLDHSRARISELEQQLGQSEEWIGRSEAMDRIREQVKRVGPTQATVLLRGESGVGKEVVARLIHQSSSRATGPFVPLNCAALTPSLLESELFGHEKGAFTGATDRKIGKFEQAHGGTIMLDELGEMSLEIQAKFLRILEGKPFERVGGNKPIQVDVRVIAATNKDLEQAVKEGQFRSDLYFRLRVIELRIPPLRERQDDILELAQHFLASFRSRSGHGPTGFSDRAKSAMLSYHWPGNVRELRNCVERAFVLSPSALAEPEDLALSYLEVPGTPSMDRERGDMKPVYRERTLDEVEQEHIAATLEFTGGQKNRAAAILGIERSTLDRKLKRSKGDPA